MVHENFSIRTTNGEDLIKSLYEVYPDMFSIKLHHGGYFTSVPGRMYLNGKVNFVDMLDAKNFCLDGLALVMKDLGYDNREPIYYHFLPPERDLNFSIKALEDDDDVLKFMEYVGENKFDIDTYTEHEKHENIDMLKFIKYDDIIKFHPFYNTQVDDTNELENKVEMTM
ncbi:hypothetical protein QVD17_19830 [Tagetes erecta]|uniref:PB1-like domain-containing protein n=1 Tax=Tagetes erecta TaxID=13708 RepID=A0AAD8NQF6_TARER|nr:hypothetical protein QVD17_19830 [Tagetes erecta]